MLEGTVHSVAGVCILAQSLGMDEQTLVSVRTLGEKLAFFSWMQVGTLAFCFFAVWEVTTTRLRSCLFDFGCRRLIWVRLLHRAKPLKTFLFYLFCLLFIEFRLLIL